MAHATDNSSISLVFNALHFHPSSVVGVQQHITWQLHRPKSIICFQTVEKNTSNHTLHLTHGTYLIVDTRNWKSQFLLKPIGNGRTPYAKEFIILYAMIMHYTA